MQSDPLSPGVLLIVGVALLISALSFYASRVYWPAKIKEAYLKSITALAAAVETKDSGTVGHAQRVARLTVEVARRLGITGEELERIEYAALLRDIGKANVPQALLTKAEPLTVDEWAVLQSHSKLGAEMAMAVPFLAGAADYILHHHEYWDGSGYPDGLKAEEIPLGARILAVASDYDAMVSERPYHAQEMTPEEALAEICRCSGLRYDPRVAEVFLRIVDEELLAESEEAIRAA